MPMQKKLLPYLLTGTLLSIILLACVSQEKVISAWTKLREKEAQLRSNEKTLDDLSEKVRTKADRNEIDDTTANRIQWFIGLSKSEIDKLEAQNEILAGKTAVDKSDWPIIRKNLEISNELLNSTADKLAMINDLMSRTLVIKIDQDIIFESGQYKATAAVEQTVSKVFEPTAKEIEAFIQKYPGRPLSVVVNANGFADAVVIAEGNSLYKDLKARIKGPAGNKDLNKELSRLRAEEVMGLFKKYFDARFKPVKNVKNILYTFEGKGEELPNPRIADYKTEDARRRVVLLYWSVFPE
jgi:hypothetical protein